MYKSNGQEALRSTDRLASHFLYLRLANAGLWELL